MIRSINVMDRTWPLELLQFNSFADDFKCGSISSNWWKHVGYFGTQHHDNFLNSDLHDLHAVLTWLYSRHRNSMFWNGNSLVAAFNTILPALYRVRRNNNTVLWYWTFNAQFHVATRELIIGNISYSSLHMSKYIYEWKRRNWPNANKRASSQPWHHQNIPTVPTIHRETARMSYNGDWIM